MENNLNKIIENLIAECECDSRVETGVFDMYNATHLVVLSEHMESMGLSQKDIEESLNAMVDEGKYPERQAFNKEGWLVTFPSKEYRDRAIKKGTHSISDPTHGKGGMNLYYKKKGKQQRQTHQDTSATEEPQTPPQKTTPPQQTVATEPSVDATDEEPETPSAPAPGQDDELMKYIASKNPGFKSNRGEKPPTKPAADSSLPPAGGGEKQPAPQADGEPQTPAAPQAPQPPAPPPPPPYVELSKKFAAQKAWISTPFGEWRDSQGNAVAVEALTKEIVPLKTTDREELKLFVQKHTSVA